MPNPTMKDVYEAIARNLREFGYPDASATMIEETHKAMKAGQPLPHGVVGMFAQSQIQNNADMIAKIEGTS